MQFGRKCNQKQAKRLLIFADNSICKRLQRNFILIVKQNGGNAYKL